MIPLRFIAQIPLRIELKTTLNFASQHDIQDSMSSYLFSQKSSQLSKTVTVLLPFLPSVIFYLHILPSPVDSSGFSFFIFSGFLAICGATAGSPYSSRNLGADEDDGTNNSGY